MSTDQATTTPTATAATGRRRRQTKGDIAVAITSHVGLSVWSILVIVPFLWTLMSSLKSSKQILSSPFSLPDRLHFENYANAWTTAGIGQFFFNTLIVVCSALVLVMILGAMLAYVLARFRFPGNRLIYTVMLASLSFPIFLAIIPLFFILQNLKLLNTSFGLILVYVAFALPFTMFFRYSFFKQLPQDVYEAAIVDGAGDWRTFFQIMLPMAGPGMASVSILNFLGLWNQYLLPLVLNSKKENYVLSQGMANFASKSGYAVDFGALFAAAVITVIPVLIVYLIFQRRLEGSVSQGTFR
jgi:N-acetylglucosamine transport system permease protein